MFQTKAVEKNKTLILYFLFLKNRAVYEIMCKNMVEPDRPQMTIWRMCITCWIHKATDIHSQYLLPFHCNNGCTNTARCYVIRTLAVLFNNIANSWSFYGYYWKIQ